MQKHVRDESEINEKKMEMQNKINWNVTFEFVFFTQAEKNDNIDDDTRGIHTRQ